VHRYRYLCRRGARKYSRAVDDRADFEQTAAVGLIKAVDRYREETGTPFEAYAWIMIQGELSHYVRDAERMVRPPRRLLALERRWRDATERLRADIGRDPSDVEVAAFLRVDEATLIELTEFRRRSRIDSLDALPVDAAASAYYTIDDEDDRITVEGALATLSPLERCIVLEIVGADRSVAEIARRLGYSARHISRVRRAAIEKLGPLCVSNAPRRGY
jgi:RNA polymerase sigma-B factor